MCGGGGGGGGGGAPKLSYTYDLSITLIRSQARGCLTTKNPV